MKTLAIGLMSGTSLDGVDAALVEIGYPQTHVELKHAISVPYEPEVRQLLLDICDIRTATIDRICQLNAYVAVHFAKVVHKLMKESKVSKKDVSFISSHGQTIYHIPESTGTNSWENAATLQIGDISYLSELTNLPVVGDFRTADMAAGGQGAPLVSYVDYMLFTHKQKNRVVQNIGGIGNLTYLKASGKKEEVISFDTGPGNMVIDACIRKISNGEKTYDENGKIATQGAVDSQLIAELMDHTYLHKTYPKTTGREDFGEQFLEVIWKKAQERKLSHRDLIATVTDWTAKTIAESYLAIEQNENIKIDEAIISGGGAHNTYLLASIQKYVPHIEIMTSNEVGIDIDQKEAIAFVMLGYDCINGRYNNIPSATGADHEVIMGKISFTKPESYEKVIQLIQNRKYLG